MDRTRATVKRIEKIPSKYYVQIPKTQAKVQTKVKIITADSLRAEHKRLTDMLRFRPALISDYTKGFLPWLKKQATVLHTSVKSALSGVRCFFRENASHFAFSGAVSGCVAAAACFLLISTCSLGCEITVNGQTIGVAQSAKAYDAMLQDINQELNYVLIDGFVPAGKPEFSPRLIPKGAFSSEADMKEQLKALSTDMLPAYGVYVDHELIFAMANETVALSVLNDYKNEFLADKTDATAEFCQTVTVSHRFVPKSALKTSESASLALHEGRMSMHQVSPGETLDSVAASYGITVDSLLLNNVIPNPDALAGMLKIPTGEALVSVKTVEFRTMEEAVPFHTIEKEDPTKYEGNIVIEQKGAEGARVVEAYITSINGVETERSIVSENVLSAAVDEIIQKGTKEPPSPIGTGHLTVPASGSLSSRFGSRWGRNHNGIDLAASTGTNIYAADNGTVVYAAYNNGGYGYMVQIDHGNGVMTYYAHCNELFAKEGAVVAKGDVIATVGNTGRSTGPHLHFEVRVNGTPIDPLSYINEIK